MTDPLDLLWASFDTPEPVFTAEAVRALPAGFQEQLTSMGLLVPADNASHVVCPSCSERHVEEVSYRECPDGQVRYSIYCPEALRVEVSPELLRQWQPDFKVLARRVKELLGIDGRVSERAPNQLWRLGVVDLKKQPREVFLARGLTRANGRQIAMHCAGQSRPIVLIGFVPPPHGYWPTLIPAVVPLPAVLSLEGDVLHLNGLLLAGMVAEADTAARQSQSVAEAELKKRIDQLVEKRLEEGPVNEVLASMVSQGMSTRQIEEDLADRGIQMDHSTVARRFQKVKRSHGVERAASSRSIVRDASSQPRDKRGRPITDAQPLEEE